MTQPPGRRPGRPDGPDGTDGSDRRLRLARINTLRMNTLPTVLLIVGACVVVASGAAMIVYLAGGFGTAAPPPASAAKQPTATQSVPATSTAPVAPPTTTPEASPTPATPPVLHIGVRGPGYVVAATWPDDALGPGARLVITPANLTTARNAVTHYVKTYTQGLPYVWIEAVAAPDQDSWMCAGESLTSAAQGRILQDQPTPTSFPATIVQCSDFKPAGGGVYYANCAAARSAGAAPVHRGEPGYGRHIDRDNNGIGCE